MVASQFNPNSDKPLKINNYSPARSAPGREASLTGKNGHYFPDSDPGRAHACQFSMPP